MITFNVNGESMSMDVNETTKYPGSPAQYFWMEILKLVANKVVQGKIVTRGAGDPKVNDFEIGGLFDEPEEENKGKVLRSDQFA